MRRIIWQISSVLLRALFINIPVLVAPLIRVFRLLVFRQILLHALILSMPAIPKEAEKNGHH